MKSSFSVILVVATIQLSCISASFAARIHDAAGEGNLAEVTRLIKLDPANRDATNEHGQTPLHMAAIYGQRDTAQALIAAGADVAAISCSNTPLHLAALNGHPDVAQALIAQGANVEARDQHHRTPLHLAAMNGRTATVQALIDAHANLEARDQYDNTPLHLAAWNNPFHLIAWNSCLNVVSALLASGANPNADNTEGKTPLKIAQGVMRDALQPQAIAQLHTQTAGAHTTAGNYALAAKSHTWAAQALPGTEQARASHTRAAECYITTRVYESASQSFDALFNSYVTRADLPQSARIAAIDGAEAQAIVALETAAAAVDGDLEDAEMRHDEVAITAFRAQAVQIQVAIEQVRSAAAAAASKAAIE